MKSKYHPIVNHHITLSKQISSIRLPNKVEWLIPYEQEQTRRAMNLFYTRFYNDQRPRKLIFGINPGRFGAGLTGVPFTDPVKLEKLLGIKTKFPQKPELSAEFMYAMFEAYGGVDLFFNQFYISSLCPLGFVKEGINFNYYDDPALTKAVTPFIIQNIQDQIKLIAAPTSIAYCLGEGQNFKYFKKINEQYNFFQEIIPLPHPRWIMQYRRKKMQEFIELYIERLCS